MSPGTIPNPRTEGFTLIEVMVAAGVIAIILIGVLSTYSTAFLADRTAAEANRAQNFCRQTLETVLGQPFETMASLSGSVVTEDTLQATIQITPVAPGLLRAEVTTISTEEEAVQCRLVTLVADTSAP